MKRFLRSKFVLSLAAIIMIAAAVVIPLSGSVTRSHAAAQSNPGQCPQGKICRVIGPSHTGTLLPKTNTNNLVVNASQDLPGLDTGIDLTVGSNITITASGQASFGIGSTQDCNTTEETQPDGQRILSDGTLCPGKTDPSAVLPSSPVGELLANFGSSGWFAVGSSDGFTAATNGRLFLLYNDISGQYGNNSGSYQVTVTTSTSSSLTIQGLYTRDGNGNVKNTFAPGDAIQYVVNVNNSSGNSMTITIHYQAFGPNQNYIYDQTFPSVTIPQGASGWFVQGTVPTNAPSGTYTMRVHVFDQNNNNNQDSQDGGQFTVATPSYDAGNFAGKSGFVSVGSYNEPNDYKHRNYCGPGASQVLISAWTSKVPGIETLAKQEKTDPNSGTFMTNMVGPINKAIGKNYYSVHYAGSLQKNFSNMIGNDILNKHHPLITGILTIYGSNKLNGWSISANHIITIYGFDFSSPSVGYIYYYETSGTVGGTSATGQNSIDYNTFWSLVQQNDIQLS